MVDAASGSQPAGASLSGVLGSGSGSGCSCDGNGGRGVASPSLLQHPPTALPIYILLYGASYGSD